MTRTNPESLTRALGRRIAQVGLAGALAAAPLALAVPAHAETDWDALAQCESGGNWSTDTGNGFSGGLQFTPSTWKAFGGSGSPENASRGEQIQVAEKVKAEQGMSAWPTCSTKTGQTSSSANSGSSGSKSSTSSTSSTSSRSSGDSESSDAASTPTSTQEVAPRTAPPRKPSAAASAPTGSHTVAPGETLSTIAERSDVAGGAQAIAERNGLADPDRIMPGQQLVLS